MIPTIDERCEFWAFRYAKTSLQEAEVYLNELREGIIENQWRAFSCGAVIAYARPFMGCFDPMGKHIKPLGAFDPPQGFEEVHQLILDVRNQAIGHKDAAMELGGSLRNPVTFRIRKGVFDTLTMAKVTIPNQSIPAMLELCDHFVEICRTNCAPFREKYRDEILRHGDGDFELVFDSPTDWLRVVPASSSS